MNTKEFVADWMNKNGPYYHQPMQRWMEKIVEDFATHIAPVASAPAVAEDRFTTDELWSIYGVLRVAGMMTFAHKVSNIINAAPQPSAAPVAADVARASKCGACGAMEGERCRTREDDRCDAGKHVAQPPADAAKGSDEDR